MTNFQGVCWPLGKKPGDTHVSSFNQLIPNRVVHQLDY
jgi:hypothetical protein